MAVYVQPPSGLPLFPTVLLAITAVDENVSNGPKLNQRNRLQPYPGPFHDFSYCNLTQPVLYVVLVLERCEAENL